MLGEAGVRGLNDNGKNTIKIIYFFKRKNNNDTKKSFMLSVNPFKMESLAGFVGEKRFKFNFYTIPGFYRLNAII